MGFFLVSPAAFYNYFFFYFEHLLRLVYGLPDGCSEEGEEEENEEEVTNREI